MGLTFSSAGSTWLTGSPSESVSDFSVSLWVKATYSSLGSYARLLDAHYATQFWIGKDSNTARLRFEAKGNAGGGVIVTPANATWAHLLFTRKSSDGANVVYLNGTSVNTGTSGTGSFTFNTFRIGANNSNSPGVDKFDGSMCRVTMWNSILDSTDANQLGNLKYAGPLVKPGNLIHNWRLLNAPSSGSWTETDTVGSLTLTASATGPTTSSDEPSGVLDSLSNRRRRILLGTA